MCAGMVLSKEKWARLTDILTRLYGISRDVETSRLRSRAATTTAPSPSLSNPGVPLATVQSSPTPLP